MSVWVLPDKFSFFLKITTTINVSLMYICKCGPAKVRDNFEEKIFCFHLYVGPKSQTQVVKYVWQVFCPLAVLPVHKDT